ncbi:uncharacterized protein LOC100175481 [Ciona intestinalis]
MPVSLFVLFVVVTITTNKGLAMNCYSCSTKTSTDCETGSVSETYSVPCSSGVCFTRTLYNPNSGAERGCGSGMESDGCSNGPDGKSLCTSTCRTNNCNTGTAPNHLDSDDSSLIPAPGQYLGIPGYSDVLNSIGGTILGGLLPNVTYNAGSGALKNGGGIVFILVSMLAPLTVQFILG